MRTALRIDGAGIGQTPRIQAAPDGLDLRDEALLLRRDIVEALHRTGGGHYGGCLSVSDILLVLYRRCLRVAPRAPPRKRVPARRRHGHRIR